MVQEDESRTRYVERRLLEAKTAGDVERISMELEAEGIPQGTISSIKSQLNKKGLLPQKDGSGALIPKAFPIQIGAKDVIPPEAALEHIRLQDGDYKLGFIDGMQTLIVAARYNQLLAAAQAEVMKTQIELLKQAKSESAEVAQQAAQEAVAGLGSQVLEAVRQQQPAAPPGEKTPAERMFGPTLDMMGQQMSGLFGNMFRMMPGFGGMPPGQHLQPQPMGESGQQSPPQSQRQMQPGQPAPSPLGTNFQTMTDEEREAIFGGGR